MAITATLVGGQSPQLVQITVSATASGVPWVISGSAGGSSWVVPGGEGVGDGLPVTLVDNRTPLSGPITYTYTPATGSPQVALPVTVMSVYDLVIQTLDGQAAVGFDMLDDSGSIELAPSHAVFNVPNRRRPVIRYAVTGDGGGSLRVGAEKTSTDAFRELLAAGAPVLIRRSVTMDDDMPLVFVALLRSIASGEYAYDIGYREWELPFLYVDDPYLDLRLGAFSWDNGFDAELAGRSWNTFDTNFASRSWDAFDSIDWTTV